MPPHATACDSRCNSMHSHGAAALGEIATAHNLDVGEVGEEEVDIHVLLVRQVGERLAPPCAAKLLHLRAAVRREGHA